MGPVRDRGVENLSMGADADCLDKRSHDCHEDWCPGSDADEDLDDCEDCPACDDFDRDEGGEAG